MEAAHVTPALRPPRVRLPLRRPKGTRKLAASGVFEAGMLSAAQLAGLRYERKVRDKLGEVLPSAEFGVWWGYYDGSMWRRCQTDGILVDGCLTIFEVKARHTIDAWWQLRKLYQPVLSVWRPDLKVNVVEVCPMVDPAVEFPEPIKRLRLDEVKEWCSEPREAFGVLKCRR